MTTNNGTAAVPNLQVAIIIPVFNDWAALAALCRNIAALAPAWPARLTILAIDDGSQTSLPDDTGLQDLTSLERVEILSLACNLGHQRAIAVGLAAAFDAGRFDVAIVTDGDGEDRPEDIGRMIEAHRAHRKSLIVARRASRSESTGFQLFYRLYKAVFRTMTGKKIDFGNFSLIPAGMLRSLLFMPESWNHLAASMLRSRMPLFRLDCARGTRYAGRSSMNFVSLLTHGISAISVFSDLVFARLLAFSAFVAAMAIAVALVATIIRMITDLAIPGWTSNVVGISALIVFQALTVSILASILLLGSRSAVAFIPATMALQFVAGRTILVDRCQP